MAFEDSFLTPSASIIPMCVLKYPLQHIPIAVNTAISFGPIRPLLKNSGTREIAPPTAPNAVIGKAIASAEWNPNNGSSINLNFSPNQGRNPTPSYAAPVYPPAGILNVNIITKVQTISTPGMIAIPISTPTLPPSKIVSRVRWNRFPSRTILTLSSD